MPRFRRFSARSCAGNCRPPPAVAVSRCFRSGPGPLTFRAGVPPDARRAASRDDPVSVGPPRRRQTAAERYHEVLPHWMRAGQPPGRREGSKRRLR